MGSFILRPPKIAISYLSSSPVSVISYEQCRVSLEEAQQCADILAAEDGSLSSNFADNTRIPQVAPDFHVSKHMYNDPAISKIRRHYAESSSLDNENHAQSKSTHRGLNKILRLVGRRPKFDPAVFYDLPYQSSLKLRKVMQDPMNFHLRLENSHECRVRRNAFPLQSGDEEVSSRNNWESKGDMIVCIRDASRPTSENLIRAYAISCSLLYNTMDYFKSLLEDNANEMVSQVSLYLRNDIWEWLLHVAKVQMKQTREAPGLITSSSALLIFSAAVFLGMERAKVISADFLKRNWAASVQDRDSKFDHTLEAAVELLGEEVLTPDYFEQCADHSEWIVEKLYKIWMDKSMQATECLSEFFPFGSAKQMFLCVYCKKWINRRIASLIPCNSKILLRRTDGRAGFGHTITLDHHFETHVDELMNTYGTFRAVFWHVYGLVNALKCSTCGNYFQLVESGHCRHHPCPPIESTERPFSTAYQCCGRIWHRMTDETSTGCSFKDHTVDVAALDMLELCKYQRMLTHQRFMWISPREITDKLSDSESAYLLPEQIRQTVQSLVGSRWELVKPLWSNQDCLREDEKNAVAALKRYFKNMSISKHINQNQHEHVDSEDLLTDTVPEDPTGSLLNELKESASLQNPKSSIDGSKALTQVIKSGPFSARNRHVPNLILPPYRGVFIRIHEEWKIKVAKCSSEITGENSTRNRNKDSLENEDGPGCKPVLRKPVVQKIPLRKVVRLPKSSDNKLRNHSRLDLITCKQSSKSQVALSKRMFAGDLPNKPHVGRKKAKQHGGKPNQQSRKCLAKWKSHHKIPVRPTKSGFVASGSPVLNDDNIILPSSSSSPSVTTLHHRMSQKQSSSSGSSSIATSSPESLPFFSGFWGKNHDKMQLGDFTAPGVYNDNPKSADTHVKQVTGKVADNSLLQKPDFERKVHQSRYRQDLSFPVATLQGIPLSLPNFPSSLPKYCLDLLEHLRPPVFRTENAYEDNRQCMDAFLQAVERYLSGAIMLRQQIHGKIWEMIKKHQTLERQRRNEFPGFETISETKRFRKRMVRIFQYLEKNRTDAFTQPYSLAAEKLRAVRAKHAAVSRIMLEADILWKKRVRKLKSTCFRKNFSDRFLNDHEPAAVQLSPSLSSSRQSQTIQPDSSDLRNRQATGQEPFGLRSERVDNIRHFCTNLPFVVSSEMSNHSDGANDATSSKFSMFSPSKQKRPGAARLKPGRKFRSPMGTVSFCTYENSSRPDFTPPKFATNILQKPGGTKTTESQPPDGLATKRSTVSADNPVACRIPLVSQPASFRSFTEAEARSLSKRIEERYAEKIAARKTSAVKVKAGKTTVDPKVQSGQLAPESSATKVKPLPATKKDGKGMALVRPFLMRKAPIKPGTPKRVAGELPAGTTTTEAVDSIQVPFRNFSVSGADVAARSNLDNSEKRGNGIPVHSVESSGFNFL